MVSRQSTAHPSVGIKLQTVWSVLTRKEKEQKMCLSFGEGNIVSLMFSVSPLVPSLDLT